MLSVEAGQALPGTAPTDREWLFVEQPGDWAPKVALPSPVTHPGARVQLIRRHGGGSGPGVRVFWAEVSPEGSAFAVRTGVRESVEAAVRVDPADLAAYDAPLWLVCTHGRRDLCCAERGRPVAAALAAAWPEETWETTHLGGHRFAATLLALPSGITLGRLEPDTAVAACEELRQGRVPLAVTRGRAGTSGLAQAAEHQVRVRAGLTGLDDVRVRGVDGAFDGGSRVLLDTPGGQAVVRVRTEPGPPLTQSCGDEKVKSAPVFHVGGPTVPREAY